MNKIENYYNLDFLKIIFTIIILLYHFIRKMGFWCEGAYAIDLFFIISGFLCIVTFNKTLTVIDFIKKRYYSFVPFLIWGILTLLFFKEFSIEKILNNIILTPVWNYDLFVSVAWYLNVLFWLSLCLFYLNKIMKKEYITWIVSLSVFISMSLMIAHDQWLVWPKIGFLNGGWFLGIMGMGVGYLFSLIPQQHNNQSSYRYLLYTVLEAFFLCYTVGCMFIKSWYISPYFIFISSCILFFLFLQKKGGISQLTDIPFFMKLRKFILPTYLLQQVPIELFYILLNKNRSLFMSYPYLTIIVTTIAIIGWGVCSYYIIKFAKFLFFKMQR
ncbi:MAG: acyltransferase family protein [Alphaproteobacteria bacterium]|nr:acyltransferase family protein [Alphaproteobacteria bacterium]